MYIYTWRLTKTVSSECELNSWPDNSVSWSVSMEFSCCGFKSHSGQLSIVTSKNLSVVTIPGRSQKSYQLQLIDKIECVIKQMRSKAHLFQNNANNTSNRTFKETYGFKSKNPSDECKETETFKKDLCNIVSSLKYRKSSDDFHEQMEKDI